MRQDGKQWHVCPSEALGLTLAGQEVLAVLEHKRGTKQPWLMVPTLLSIPELHSGVDALQNMSWCGFPAFRDVTALQIQHRHSFLILLTWFALCKWMWGCKKTQQHTFGL